MAERMPYVDRRTWLLQAIANEQGGRVDVLNSDFVVDYAEYTGSKAAVQFFGAPRCPQLGADLGRMHREGYVKRATVGIGDGLSGQGFPKWVYSYRLSTFGQGFTASEPEPANG